MTVARIVQGAGAVVGRDDRFGGGGKEDVRDQLRDDLAPLRPAATVILARPGSVGYEVFMARRIPRGAFGGAFVFPGGSVQEDDDLTAPTAFRADDALRTLSERGGTPPASAALARALFQAAIREVFEEAGVLLARDAQSGPFQILPSDAARWAALRTALQARQISFSAVLAAGPVVPDYARLIYFSHWITPRGEPRRFDTRFFLAAVPPEQTATHAEDELTESLWITPAAALAQADADRFPIVFPTRQHLLRLAGFSSLADLLAFARTKPIRTVETIRELVHGERRVYLPEEVRECW